MKALEYLKEKLTKLCMSFDGVWISQEELDEAAKELEKIVKENSEDRLAELEALEIQNKSLVKTLEKYNEEMIDLRKENQDLKNRSCVTCKYGHTYQFDEDIECIKLGADTQGLYFEKDFYCKNWELK